MVTLSVKRVISDFSNNNVSGQVLFNSIKNHLDEQESVLVSFEGISELSSSFVNSAFIELLTFYDFNYIRDNVKFTHSTRQINDLIKSRFNFEINKKVACLS
ncbi:DUF4325 domain-containing protein [Lactococcus lactis]|uniref:STAS-like domain-containing protein n=1 Tax=Lactococcus lactis TaxID=1358 RepID=UPI00223A935F|nr:STAS-like domain-containing protein [Lactococcus lactis]MCT1181731.1 DUF4325 domain-containing protein [Lactococcus lactis]